MRVRIASDPCGGEASAFRFRPDSGRGPGRGAQGRDGSGRDLAPAQARGQPPGDPSVAGRVGCRWSPIRGKCQWPASGSNIRTAGSACRAAATMVRSVAQTVPRVVPAREHRQQHQPRAGRGTSDRRDEALHPLPDEGQRRHVVVAALDDDGLRVGAGEVQPGRQAGERAAMAGPGLTYPAPRSALTMSPQCMMRARSSGQASLRCPAPTPAENDAPTTASSGRAARRADPCPAAG